MPKFRRRLLVVLAVCGCGVLVGALGAAALSGTAAGQSTHRGQAGHTVAQGKASHTAARAHPWQHVWTVDAQRGVREFLGGDITRVGWSRKLAEWGGTV